MTDAQTPNTPPEGGAKPLTSAQKFARAYEDRRFDDAGEVLGLYLEVGGTEAFYEDASEIYPGSDGGLEASLVWPDGSSLVWYQKDRVVVVDPEAQS